jgi:hypothetical protein
MSDSTELVEVSWVRLLRDFCGRTKSEAKWVFRAIRQRFSGEAETDDSLGACRISPRSGYQI